MFDIVLAGHVSNLTKWIFQKSGASTTNWSSVFGIRNFMAFPKEQLQSTREDFHRSFLESQVFPKTTRFRRRVGSFFGAKKLLALPKASSVVSMSIWFVLDLFLGGWWKGHFPRLNTVWAKKKIQYSLNQLMVLLCNTRDDVCVSSFKYVVSDVCLPSFPHLFSPRSSNILRPTAKQKITPPKCLSLLLMEEIPINHLECNNILWIRDKLPTSTGAGFQPSTVSNFKTLPRSQNLGVALLMMWRHAVAIWAFSGLLAVAQPGVAWFRWLKVAFVFGETMRYV